MNCWPSSLTADTSWLKVGSPTRFGGSRSASLHRVEGSALCAEHGKHTVTAACCSDPFVIPESRKSPSEVSSPTGSRAAVEAPVLTRTRLNEVENYDPVWRHSLPAQGAVAP
jgi:hypothetical protein